MQAPRSAEPRVSRSSRSALARAPRPGEPELPVASSARQPTARPDAAAAGPAHGRRKADKQPHVSSSSSSSSTRHRTAAGLRTAGSSKLRRRSGPSKGPAAPAHGSSLQGAWGGSGADAHESHAARAQQDWATAPELAEPARAAHGRLAADSWAMAAATQALQEVIGADAEQSRADSGLARPGGRRTAHRSTLGRGAARASAPRAGTGRRRAGSRGPAPRRASPQRPASRPRGGSRARRRARPADNHAGRPASRAASRPRRAARLPAAGQHGSHAPEPAEPSRHAAAAGDALLAGPAPRRSRTSSRRRAPPTRQRHTQGQAPAAAGLPARRPVTPPRAPPSRDGRPFAAETARWHASVQLGGQRRSAPRTNAQASARPRGSSRGRSEPIHASPVRPSRSRQRVQARANGLPVWTSTGAATRGSSSSARAATREHMHTARRRPSPQPRRRSTSKRAPGRPASAAAGRRRAGSRPPRRSRAAFGPDAGAPLPQTMLPEAGADCGPEPPVEAEEMPPPSLTQSSAGSPTAATTPPPPAEWTSVEAAKMLAARRVASTSTRLAELEETVRALQARIVQMGGDP